MAAERYEIHALLERPCEPPSGAAASSGRACFIGALIERHRRTLLWYLSRLGPSVTEAEEAVQEACVKLLQVAYLDHDAARARSYLFRTAVNAARDLYRRRRARCEPLHVGIDDVPLEAQTPSPERLVDAERGLKVALAALNDLSPRTRTAFLMHVVDELSYDCIAARLGVSKKTIERDVAMTLELCRVRFSRWSAS
jgi:RNA polymerase sigma factor (sigma-70 family)